jgi:hypothetical protein
MQASIEIGKIADLYQQIREITTITYFYQTCNYCLNVIKTQNISVLPLSESIFYLICQKFLLGAPYFILFIIVSDVNYITQYFLSSDWLVLASGKPYLA